MDLLIPVGAHVTASIPMHFSFMFNITFTFVTTVAEMQAQTMQIHAAAAANV